VGFVCRLLLGVQFAEAGQGRAGQTDTEQVKQSRQRSATGRTATAATAAMAAATGAAAAATPTRSSRRRDEGASCPYEQDGGCTTRRMHCQDASVSLRAPNDAGPGHMAHDRSFSLAGLHRAPRRPLANRSAVP